MAKIILGLGAGQCGLKLLADIFKSQPGVQMTCEEKPLLPWKMSTGKLVGCEEIPIQLQDRFQRWSQTRHAHFYGDVSSSYLSYVEEAIQLIPDIRLICLQRPKQDIISGFCNWCDRQFRRPVNNWSETLPIGWYRDPLTYSMYPKYPVSHRDIALGMYYDEYYTKANLFVQRFPDQFRLLDTEVLTHTEGVRDLLDFIGIPSSDQNLVMGNSPDALPAYLPDEVVHARWQEELSQRPPSHCVILVPFLGYIHQECDASLKALEQRGYQVRRVGGYSAID